MATGRKLVSDVRAYHKILSTDSLLSDRAILSEIKSSAFLLVKRESNLRKLWATDTLFTTIPCLEMEEVPISQCCAYVDDCKVSRSKYRIPNIAEGNYQYIIQGVWSINAMGGKGKKLKEITINRYLNLLNLPVIKKEEYFWIVDDYLYTNNPFLKSLRIAAYFQDDVPNEIMFPDCDCTNSSYDLNDVCKNPLDKEFPLPGYLEKQVIDLTSQRLLNTYFRLKSDETSQGIDAQAPDTTATE